MKKPFTVLLAAMSTAFGLSAADKPADDSKLESAIVGGGCFWCVEAQYKQRTAELQSKYRLVAQKGPVFFACQNNPSNEVVATFFETDPPTAALERGDRTVIAYQVRSASGAKYEGQNAEFWNKGNEATVSWMNPATGVTEALNCTLRR